MSPYGTEINAEDDGRLILINYGRSISPGDRVCFLFAERPLDEAEIAWLDRALNGNRRIGYVVLSAFWNAETLHM